MWQHKVLLGYDRSEAETGTKLDASAEVGSDGLGKLRSANNPIHGSVVRMIQEICGPGIESECLLVAHCTALLLKSERAIQ